MRKYRETIETDFTGLELTPVLVQDSQDTFLRNALEANPDGTQGDPILVSSTLVTGQKAALTFEVVLVDGDDDGPVATPIETGGEIVNAEEQDSGNGDGPIGSIPNIITH